MMAAPTLHVLLVVFLATMIRSTFGFGEALIAVVVIVQDWRKIHTGSAGWLLAATLPGIPLGLLLLTSIHQHAVKAVLAIVIMAFSGYFLLGKKPPELTGENRKWLLGCGFC